MSDWPIYRELWQGEIYMPIVYKDFDGSMSVDWPVEAPAVCLLTRDLFLSMVASLSEYQRTELR